MSIFENERKRLGLPAVSSGASPSKSIFQKEREKIMSGQPTRFEEIKSNKVDNDRFAAKYKNDPRNKIETTPKKSTKKKQDDGILDNIKGFLTGEKVIEGFSIRDKKKGDSDTTLNKIGKVREGEKPTEVDRFIANAQNSAALGIPKEMAKRSGDELTLNSFYNEREIGEGGGTDMIAQGMGYLVPGAGTIKSVRAFGLGAKSIPKLANGASKAEKVARALKVGAQLGKEGTVVGGAMAGAEVGVREGLNPMEQNWKDNTKHIAFGAGTGLVADPLLHGAVKGIGKGVDIGLKKWIPDLPERTPNEGFDIPDPKGNISTLPKKTDPINIDPAFNTKRYYNPNQPLNEFLGKPQKESDLLKMAKKVNYTNRELPDFSNSQYTIGKPDSDIISTHFGIEVPKDLVESATPQYWQKRYEDFTAHVKQNYDTNQLTKEGLDDLWTQFARYDEPVTLEQVVDLAYKGYKEPKNLNANETWGHLGNRPPVSQNAKKILGIDDSMFLKNKGQQIPTKLPVSEPIPQGTIKRTIYKPEIKTNQVEQPFIQNQTDLANPKLDSPTIVQNQSEPKQPINVPRQNDSAFFNTVVKQEKTTDEMFQRLNDFDKSYTPMSNQETVDFANKYIANDIEKAYQFVKNARKFDPRHITVGHRLIDEFQARGDFDRAVDVVERLAEQGTKAGQSIQAFSIYGRLTAQGQLLRAQRVLNRINHDIPNVEKQVKLDRVAVNNITHAADSIQKLTGQEDVAKNVMNIMDSIKKGNTATDDELDVIRSFVQDAKKFVGDISPKPERVKVKKNDPRTRDKVVDFMSKQEEVAMKRIRERMSRANSLPLDMIYDLGVVGASKIAKGTVKFADFTEAMVKDFGEEIRPYMKQIWDKAAETFNLQSEKLTAKRLSEVEKIVNKATKDKTLSADQANDINKFLMEYLRLTGDAKLEASMQLQSTLQLLERPTFFQKVSTAQTIAQLLNPKTIVRNAIGNEIFYRVEEMNKFVSTPIDIVRSKINGTQRSVTFRTHNQGQYWRNWMTGLKAGWQGVNPMGLQTMYDLGPQAFRASWNPMTWFEKALGATLRSFDHAGYMRAYNKTLGEIATLQAMNEGLKGKALKEAVARYIREADENMLNIADQYAKYATFQDNTMLATGLQKVKKGMNRVSTLGVTDEFGLGDLVLKYPKTPGNIIMRALEYSPAGLVRGAHLLYQALRTKNPLETRETTLAFTRAIVGTGGFSLMGYALADLGILTSSGHSDYEVASLERNAGKQPNSVNLSALTRFVQSGFNVKEANTQENDTFFSYDWAQPVSLAMALGTGTSQAMKEDKELNTGNVVKTAFDSASDTIMEMSVLGGLKDFLATYPGKKPSDYIADPVKGIASSFTPTFLNQFRQLNSNTARSTYSPSFFDEIGNKAINRVPGMDDSLPNAYDTLGNQREVFQNDSNNPLNVFLNPSFVSKYKPSEEAKFVLDFINETGDKSVAPKIASKKLDGVKLTGEQHSEYQRIMGEETQKGLKKLVPKLQNIEDKETIRKHLEKVLRQAGEAARRELRKELSE